MRDLYTVVESDPQIPCPVHVLEKAHRCAERIGVRMEKVRVSHDSPDTVQTAIRDLETLRKWCDELSGVKSSESDNSHTVG